MKTAYIFLANGFEDIEAITTIDVLRRGSVTVNLVSISDEPFVTSAHGITIGADMLFEDADFEDADLLVLPGGMPGAENLNNHAPLRDLLHQHCASGKRIGAICAAPMVLGNAGLLDNRRATCYPGFENMLGQATHVEDGVVTDGNITTAKGPAFSLPFAYTLLGLITDEATRKQVESGMLYK